MVLRFSRTEPMKTNHYADLAMLVLSRLGMGDKENKMHNDYDESDLNRLCKLVLDCLRLDMPEHVRVGSDLVFQA